MTPIDRGLILGAALIALFTVSYLAATRTANTETPTIHHTHTWRDER